MDDNHIRKRKSDKAKLTYDKYGKFNARAIRIKEEQKINKIESKIKE